MYSKFMQTDSADSRSISTKTGKGHIFLTTRFGPLGVHAAIEKSHGFEELLMDAVEIEFQGFKVYVLRARAKTQKPPRYKVGMALPDITLFKMAR